MTTSRGKNATSRVVRGSVKSRKSLRTQWVLQELREKSKKLRAREQLEAFTSHLHALKSSTSTVKAYTYNLRPFFTWLIERKIKDIRSVTTAHYEAYQDYLTACGRYKPYSVHMMLRSVKRFLAYLEKTGHIFLNPAETVPYPDLGDRLPRNILTLTEVKKLLEQPDTSTPAGIRDRAILEMFYSTGIRIGELCALTIHDIDLNGGYVRINQGKGSKDRVVPLGRHATAYMKEYLKHVRSKWAKKKREERTLFLNRRTHNSISHMILARTIREYARQARIRKTITAHSLRHTCATHMLAGGADIAYVQRILGHSDINTTQLYVQVARREAKETHARCHPGEKEPMPGNFEQPFRYFKRPKQEE